MENIYESRRLDLRAMIDAMGRGAIAKVAADLKIDPNYLSRCLYPHGKKGKKNIGDELVIKLNEKYPMWSSSWKAGFIEGESIHVFTKQDSLSVLASPQKTVHIFPSTVTFQTLRERQIGELVSLANTMSDEGMSIAIYEAKKIAEQYPAQAKQTRESSE